MSAILSFSIMILLGIVVTWIFELILKSNKILRNKYYKHHQVVLGYHIHHSSYGVLCFIISLIYLINDQPKHSLLMSGFGIGIIIMHTISDGRFVFIEKQKK